MKQKIYLSNDYFSDLMIRMAHHSTAIEGNTLTQGETKSILIDNYIPRAMNMRELHEVLNYKAYVRQMIEDLKQDVPIDVEYIKSVHAVLCNNAIEGIAGRFKTIPNLVIGADFTPTPPYLVPSELENWRLNLQYQLEHAENNDEIIESILRQHIQFEHIHPFSDGNGRVGRALIVYSCLRAHIVPAVIPVQDKGRYINYLNTEDIPGFVLYAKELQQTELMRIQALANDAERDLYIWLPADERRQS